MTEINFDLINSIDYQKFDNEWYNNCKEASQNPSRSEYKLLSYFSTLFDNSIICEIGTRNGGSAIALSYNPTNKVITYDIVQHGIFKNNRKNIEFKIENIIDSEHKMQNLLNSCIINIDIDPHDGKKEEIIHNFLLKNNYKGLVFYDDIGPKWEFTKKQFDSINIKKYDMSFVGHCSGTGLVDYSNNFNLILHK